MQNDILTFTVLNKIFHWWVNSYLSLYETWDLAEDTVITAMILLRNKWWTEKSSSQSSDRQRTCNYHCQRIAHRHKWLYQCQSHPALTTNTDKGCYVSFLFLSLESRQSYTSALFIHTNIHDKGTLKDQSPAAQTAISISNTQSAVGPGRFRDVGGDIRWDVNPHCCPLCCRGVWQHTEY